MKVYERAIIDQGERLRSLALKHGIDSKRLDAQFQQYCVYWLELGPVANAFNREEYDNLRKNYEWVCNRLKELETSK